jgi:hypothetical protein
MALQPMAMDELVDNQGFRYTPTDGKLSIFTTPDCDATMLMLPICFFAGCFLSSTVSLTFDDNSQTITGSASYGYLICFPTNYSFSYSDVGNVGYACTGFNSNKRPTYRAWIIMRNRTKIPFSAAHYFSETREKVLAMHQFLFGRNNSQYEAPEIGTLYIEETLRA